jgi:hypothetical protein
MRLGRIVGLFAAAWGLVAPTLHHEPSALNPDQAVILPPFHDSADEEARNATPIQEPAIAELAIPPTQTVTVDFPVSVEFTSTI